MEDETIEMALELHASGKKEDCLICPYLLYECSSLAKDALEYIRRLKSVGNQKGKNE